MNKRILSFAKLVERNGLHGLVFQHLALCERRAWFHLQRIDYSHLEERMEIGRVAHELAKPRDHSVEGLMGLYPDRIDWAECRVIEAKYKEGASDAVGMQTAFYALMLTAITGKRWRAGNDILSQKRYREVIIDDAIIDKMIKFAKRAAELVREDFPPKAKRKPICKSCSYRFLCGYH